MTVIVAWFNSCEALKLPTIPILTEYKTITIGLKHFKNSCLYKQPFYLQTMSFGLNTVPMITNFCLLCGLK